MNKSSTEILFLFYMGVEKLVKKYPVLLELILLAFRRMQVFKEIVSFTVTGLIPEFIPGKDF